MSHRLHATNLREAAERYGDFSDYRISKRAGIPRATLSRLVNGQGEPTITTLMRLAACYRMTVESLVRETETSVAA
jgi:transcriptional regulator with XRE-family HTH domain